jgi:hypothetical protein
MRPGFLAALAVLALLVVFPLPGAAQESKEFSRVELTRGDGASGTDVTKVVLVSGKDAEITTSEGTSEPAAWSLRPGPDVRIVRKDGSVLQIGLLPGGTWLRPGNVRFVASAGAEWIAATAAREDLRSAPERYSTKTSWFVLHADGAADWSGAKSSIVDAKRSVGPDGRELTLTLPDGTKREFQRDGDHWREAATGALFRAAADERKGRETCMQNLRTLGASFRAQWEENQPRAQRYSGVSMFLAWRKAGVVVKRGDENVLRCPGDPHLRALDDAARKAYDGADLDDPPDDLCSYAGRDFKCYPVNVEGNRGEEILACCRQGRDGRTPHHAEGVVVLFMNGDVRFLGPEEAGYGPDEAIVVGRESKNRMLAKVIQRQER